MTVRIINKSHHPLPQFETEGSAGMDLRAYLDQPIELQPLERALIPTGLFVELPQGFEAQIRPRSGLAIRQGLTIINAPGTIDSDYRGEIKVGIVNLSSTTQVISDGDRIAQMIISRYERISWEESEELVETERGAGGFGHTGIS